MEDAPTGTGFGLIATVPPPAPVTAADSCSGTPSRLVSRNW
jgi:hypothetical protein